MKNLKQSAPSCQKTAPAEPLGKHFLAVLNLIVVLYSPYAVAENCAPRGANPRNMQVFPCLSDNPVDRLAAAGTVARKVSEISERGSAAQGAGNSGRIGPVIEGLVAEVLSAHPSIRAQNALIDQAQSGVDSARWQFFPTPAISVDNANSGANDPSYAGDSTVRVFKLQQPLWTGGRLTAGLEKAQANAFAAESSREESRQQLAMRVVQSYGDWFAAHLKAKAWKKSLEVHETLQQHVRRRIDAGAAAESDFKLSEGRILSIKADDSAVAAQHDAALTWLGELLGREIGVVELARRDARLPSASPSLQSLLRQAEENLPALKRAAFQVGAAEAEIDERRADLLPELYLRYENQRGNFSYSAAGSENRVFVGLSSRFGAGLSSLSGVSGATAKRDAAREEREVVRREMRAQIMADHSALASVQSRLVSLKDSLVSAKEVSDSYLRQFLAGKRSWLDVMNAAREVAQIEVQLGDSRGALVVLSWRLHIMANGVPDIGAHE